MNDHAINILFTSSGRRVSLVKKFKEAFVLHQIKGRIVTADLKNTAPTAFFGDQHYLVPRVTEDNYLEELLQICQKENIHLIIPLIDSELMLLAANRSKFDQISVKLLLSSIELNEIAFDKKKTYSFFVDNHIATPRVYSDEEIARQEFEFPVLLKPYNGSSSQGVYVINNAKELIFFQEYIPNAMVQEYVTGDEYTVDVMLDLFGHVKTIVPRLRIETRAGEVSKGITKKDADVIAAVRDVVSKLPGPIGCITLQCFKKANGEITFIEINPRFGGGVPLSIAAGADFPLWTISLCQGVTFEEEDFDWRDELTMLRFDDAVFTQSVG